MFRSMSECAKWFKSKQVNAEVGIDYIFINFDKSIDYTVKEGAIPFLLLKELAENLACKFSISSLIPDPTDDSFLGGVEKRLPQVKVY